VPSSIREILIRREENLRFSVSLCGQRHTCAMRALNVHERGSFKLEITPDGFPVLIGSDRHLDKSRTRRVIAEILRGLVREGTREFR